MDGRAQGTSQSFSFGSVAYPDDLDLLPEETGCQMVENARRHGERETNDGGAEKHGGLTLNHTVSPEREARKRCREVVILREPWICGALGPHSPRGLDQTDSMNDGGVGQSSRAQ